MTDKRGNSVYLGCRYPEFGVITVGFILPRMTQLDGATWGCFWAWVWFCMRKSLYRLIWAKPFDHHSLPFGNAEELLVETAAK